MTADELPRVVLDWRTHKVAAAPMELGQLDRAGLCALCGRPAWMRDELRRPCHKVCAEQVVAEKNAAAAAAYAAGNRPDLVDLPTGRLAIDTTGVPA
jgi:hypothetical protein